MPSIRSILLLGLPLASICAAENQQRRQYVREEQDNFGALDAIVNSLPEESVRSVLKNTLGTKYRDGVFEHNKKALEAVHHDDPQLATKLVDDAMHEEFEKSDLRKRQNGTEPSTTVITTTSSTVIENPSTTTTQVTTDTQTTTTEDNGGGATTTNDNGGGATTTNDNGGGATTTADNGGGATTTADDGGAGTTDSGNTGGGDNSAPATQTGVIVPVTQVTTDDSGNTVTRTTSAFQQTAETSAVVAVTTTNAQGEQVTRSETVPAALETTTNAQGDTITRASPLTTARVAGGTIVGGGNGGTAYTTTDRFGNSIVLSGTAGQVITTTDSRGRTVVMTYTPGGGEVSELVLKTTNLPGGGKSTITSFALVGGQTTGGSTQTGNDGLQSGIAAPTARYVGEVAAIVGGAMGVAAVLL